MKRIVAGIVSAFFAMSAAAVADDAVSTQVVGNASAPAAITRCAVVSQNWGYFHPALNIYNRSSHAMIDATVEYRIYDRDDTQMGQGTATYTQNGTVSPRDTITFNSDSLHINLSEPQNAVSRVTCRLVGASFTGRNNWRPGATWRGGALSATPRPHHVDEDDSGSAGAVPSGSGNSDRSASRSEHLQFEVSNAWNDASQGGTFVHDTLTIHGGEHDLMVRPEMFQLWLALANGAKKSYSALSQGAPQFSRYNAVLGQTQLQPQVDPATDLGRLGSITVPAHGTVTVTVTFPVPDAIADANANRDVVFH